jgi:quercetin dioxygenase-like cupin family protein
LRLSPRDLRAVRSQGLLTRFAILGPVAFVLAEISEHGTRSTVLEDPCQQEHWGIMLAGELSVAWDSRSEKLNPGTAFYVHPGKPGHHFEGAGASAVAGFAPVEPDLDVSEAGLRRRGLEPVGRPGLPPPAMPSSVQLAGPPRSSMPIGDVDVEMVPMGSWICSRTNFGRSSGYATDWCDLPHWGIVLSGSIGIQWENDLELLSAGDVYYCPAGPPGHRLEAPDGGVTLDYTPATDMQTVERQADWRRTAGATLLRGATRKTPRVARQARRSVRARFASGATPTDASKAA